LLTSPYLRIENIIVEGLDEATEQEVLKMSQQNLTSSLLAANLDDLKKTIEKDPWIDSVELHKRFPHTLVILAQKEKPWAVVVLGDLYYMNRKGKMFKKVSHNENIDYPLITGISGTGDDKEMQLKLAAQVLGTLEREKGSWALDELSEVHVTQNGNVSLFFRSLPVIVKVKGSELEAKIDELKRVVAHLNRTGRISLVKEINLNYGDGAVVSFKNS
jgi:cell division septal protein FtsQ